jgi:thioredoxin 1
LHIVRKDGKCPFVRLAGGAMDVRRLGCLLYQAHAELTEREAMATVEVTEKNFNEITRQGTVLLDWWAEWCGPCKTFAPVYEEASARHPEVVFGKIDTEAQQNLAASFGIQSIPTVMVIRDGVMLFSQAGALPASLLDELITKVQEVDMDEVRTRIAEAEREAAADDKKGPPS